ncbi:hypothetical protein Tco_0268931 [Tanacetum coccineum]
MCCLMLAQAGFYHLHVNDSLLMLWQKSQGLMRRLYSDLDFSDRRLETECYTFSNNQLTRMGLCIESLGPMTVFNVRQHLSVSDSILIIMAQQQHAADVHPDKLCPPNKRYDLMDTNKKVDFEQVQSSSSVPWMYMAQFWHTLKEDGSKYRLTFMLDKKMLSLTLDDFRTIFHLPQANDNNHDSFVPPPSFLDMVPFYKNELGFTLELKTSSSFKTTSLLQLWQTLCKIFFKCLTTRVTRWDQPPLPIMQMMYCEQLKVYENYDPVVLDTNDLTMPNDSTPIQDVLEKITDERKLYGHYKMYAVVFWVDVPLTQLIQVCLAEQQESEEQEASENGGHWHSSTWNAEEIEKRRVFLGKEKEPKKRNGKINLQSYHARIVGRMQAHISSQIQNVIDNAIPSLVDASVRSYMSEFISSCSSAQARIVQKAKTSEYEAYVSGESSSGQVNVEEPGPSTSGNQEQDDEFDF